MTNKGTLFRTECDIKEVDIYSNGILSSTAEFIHDRNKPHVNINYYHHHHHHHHVPEGLGMLACSLVLKMKLVPPSLPRSSYVSSSFWFIL